MNLTVPLDAALSSVWFPDHARNGTFLIAAQPGAGKTRLLGRRVIWWDFCRGLPMVVLDPVGSLRDQFFDMICRIQPEEHQLPFWDRVRYVDLAGRYGHVQRNPLYYRLAGDSLYVAAQRFVDAIDHSDPDLRSAGVQGLNAFSEVASNTGMALLALGEQLPTAMEMLNRPKAFLEPLARAARHYPEARGVSDWLVHRYDSLPGREQSSLTMTYRRKVMPFVFDPAFRAQFCQAPAQIDFDEVIRKRQLVFVDVSGFEDKVRKRFGLLWFFRQVMEFVNRRPVERQLPFGLVIDELSHLVPADTAQGVNPIADDLMDLITRLGRNKGMWITLSTQGIDQLSERTQLALSYCSGYVLGSTPNPDWALSVAKRYRKWEPNWVRKREIHITPGYRSEPDVINETTTEYTIEEQQYLHAWRQMDLETNEFYAIFAQREGTPPREMQKISTASIDPGCQPESDKVEWAARVLSERDGVPIDGTFYQERIEEGEEEPAPKGTQSPRERRRPPRVAPN